MVVSSSFALFSSIKEQSLQAASVKTLDAVTSHVASTLLEALETAKKGSIESSLEPAVNLSVKLPRKIGDQDYSVNVTNNTVLGTTRNGLVTSNVTLPYALNSSVLFDSALPEHRIIVYRLNSSSYNLSVS